MNILEHAKKHWVWYAAGAGIGLALFFYFRSKGASATNSAGQGTASTATTGLNTTDYNGASGQGQILAQSPDTSWQDSIASLMSGLTQTEAQNYNLLNQIASSTQAGGSGATGLGTVTNNPVQSTPISHPITPQPIKKPINPVQPWAKNTAGASNNFWLYTTRPGDTLDSISQLAHWDTAHNDQFLTNYRNNAAIFSSLGVAPNTQNAAVPAGYQISL